MKLSLIPDQLISSLISDLFNYEPVADQNHGFTDVKIMIPMLPIQ